MPDIAECLWHCRVFTTFLQIPAEIVRTFSGIPYKHIFLRKTDSSPQKERWRRFTVYQPVASWKMRCSSRGEAARDQRAESTSIRVINSQTNAARQLVNGWRTLVKLGLHPANEEAKSTARIICLLYFFF